jgi:hypothetical protein
MNKKIYLVLSAFGGFRVFVGGSAPEWMKPLHQQRERHIYMAREVGG